jgi:hypothetical protein
MNNKSLQIIPIITQMNEKAIPIQPFYHLSIRGYKLLIVIYSSAKISVISGKFPPANPLFA